MSIILKLEMPEGAFSALREDPEGGYHHYLSGTTNEIKTA